MFFKSFFKHLIFSYKFAFIVIDDKIYVDQIDKYKFLSLRDIRYVYNRKEKQIIKDKSYKIVIL